MQKITWDYVFEIPQEVHYLMKYLMLALRCDMPILESVFLTYPLYIHFSSIYPHFEELYGVFYSILEIMSEPSSFRLIPGLIAEASEYAQEDSFYTEDDQHALKLTLNLVRGEVTCWIVPLERLPDPEEHLAAFRILRDTKTGDGYILVNGIPNWISEREQLRTTIYPFQIQRLFKVFMAKMPSYWSNKKPFPIVKF